LPQALPSILVGPSGKQRVVVIFANQMATNAPDEGLDDHQSLIPRWKRGSTFHLKNRVIGPVVGVGPGFFNMVSAGLEPWLKQF